MSVRRGAARLAAVGAVLGGLLAVGATPALAEDDSVRVRSASTFTAGGSAGSVSMEIKKRTDGCVLVRTGLVLRLDGVTADQVKVQVATGGQWWPVPVSGNDTLATARTAPSNPRLCKDKSVTVKYRVAFTDDAPSGRLAVVGEAVTAVGRTIGRAADASRVVGGRSAAVTPSASPSRTPSPSPSPSEVAADPLASTDGAPTLVGVGAGAGGQGAEEESGSFGGSLVMIFGIAMVGVGIALIVLLVRRSRAEREPAGGYPAAPDSTMLLPSNPGGTTYRSAGPPPATGAQYGIPGTPVTPAQAAWPGAPTSGSGFPPPPAPSGGDATAIIPRFPG